MIKTFIWSICGECKEPIHVISPCDELGWNDFPLTNFHGELSFEDTEKLRLELIQSLIDDGQLDKAEAIKNNTKVLTVQFLNYETKTN